MSEQNIHRNDLALRIHMDVMGRDPFDAEQRDALALWMANPDTDLGAAVVKLIAHARAEGRRAGLEESRREIELLRNLARAAAEFCDCPHDSFGCEASEEFTEALGAYNDEYPIQACSVPACGGNILKP